MSTCKRFVAGGGGGGGCSGNVVDELIEAMLCS